jgi:hypothetical protein
MDSDADDDHVIVNTALDYTKVKNKVLNIKIYYRIFFI